ncbi:hypothetical protein V6Z12_D06G189500 [Gossypium hirsutum]
MCECTKSGVEGPFGIGEFFRLIEEGVLQTSSFHTPNLPAPCILPHHIYSPPFRVPFISSCTSQPQSPITSSQMRPKLLLRVHSAICRDYHRAVFINMINYTTHITKIIQFLIPH